MKSSAPDWALFTLIFIGTFMIFGRWNYNQRYGVSCWPPAQTKAQQDVYANIVCGKKLKNNQVWTTMPEENIPSEDSNQDYVDGYNWPVPYGIIAVVQVVTSCSLLAICLAVSNHQSLPGPVRILATLLSHGAASAAVLGCGIASIVLRSRLADFPEVFLCDFDIRQLGNVHRHTYQCTAPSTLSTDTALLSNTIVCFIWAALVIGRCLASLACPRTKAQQHESNVPLSAC